MMTRFCEIDERELFSVYIMRGEKKGKNKKKNYSMQCGERNLVHREWVSPDV